MSRANGPISARDMLRGVEERFKQYKKQKKKPKLPPNPFICHGSAKEYNLKSSNALEEIENKKDPAFCKHAKAIKRFGLKGYIGWASKHARPGGKYQLSRLKI